jgi:hypothetical protein
VLAAAREAFAVNHHRACERQPRHAGARHAGEQRRSAGVVRRGVIRHIGDIDAEPDLRGEVDHRIDPGQRAIDRRAVAHVANLRLDSGRRCPARARVHVRAQRIERASLVTAPEQVAYHVPTDEARAAGHQHSHLHAFLNCRDRLLGGERQYRSPVCLILSHKPVIAARSGAMRAWVPRGLHTETVRARMPSGGRRFRVRWSQLAPSPSPPGPLAFDATTVIERSFRPLAGARPSRGSRPVRARPIRS